MWLKFSVLIIPWCSSVLVFSNKVAPDTARIRHYLQEASGPIASILEATYKYDCSIIYVVDSKISAYSTKLIKDLDDKAKAPRGATFMELEIDGSKPNASMSDITPLVQEASWLRRRSWCVIVVMLSNDPVFLELVGQVAKMERLVGWSTKLLVVTEINFSHLQRIISFHWTYCMMSTMFLNAERNGDDSFGWTAYAFYPYGPRGPQVFKLASYRQELYVYKGCQLFPDKYRNFHGGVVNVTAKEHTPHFMAKVVPKPDGTNETIIYGSDGLLLHAMEDILNFTSYLLHTDTWEEVKQFIMDRKAYISPVYWDLVPERLIQHDMTVVYEHAYFAFSMASTPPKPHWSGLFLPLTIDTWLGILLMVFVASATFALTLYMKESKRVSTISQALSEGTYEIIATLLDQNFNFLLPTSAAGRTLMFSWLVFTFILSSVYRANLKAYLMKPSPPLRAETVEELVEIVNEVSAESYLHSTKVFFMDSDYPPYKKLGDFMEIGAETSVGMQQAADNRRAAHVDFLKHMNHVMVEKFTKPDGTTALYIGKSRIAHFPSSMPMPHDIPFLPHVNDIILHVVEAGLMDKWYMDEIDLARRKSLTQQRDYRQKLLEANIKVEVETSEDGEVVASLSLAHLQGPFILFAGGVGVGFFVLMVEIASGALHCC